MTEAQAHSQSTAAPAAGSSQVPSMQDRGLYHAADAMRDMYDMGDAPSCGDVRRDHGAQRELLSLHELRVDIGLLLKVGAV